MLADLSDRRTRREPAPLAAPDAGGRRVVAAFKHRLHAERAVGALLDSGLTVEQIRLEGPAAALEAPTEADDRPGRPGLGEGAACAALFGAAAWRVVPTARLIVTLGLPILAIGLVAGLTVVANPGGLELFPWTVVVVGPEPLVDVGGLLRAFGGRGVYLS